MIDSGNMEKFIKVSLERVSVGKREAPVINPDSLGCKTLFDLVFFSLFYFLVGIPLLTGFFVEKFKDGWFLCIYMISFPVQNVCFLCLSPDFCAFHARPSMTVDIGMSRFKKLFFTCWKYPVRESENPSLWNMWQSTQEIDARNAAITGKFHLKLSCF